uniref:Uncharacterized protein n=1 Tax=Fagus sylvatica TaxID=28930 RepID=A0A2N9ICR2_FAGSY
MDVAQEPFYLNRMASDVMDHPIRLVFRCFLEWVYDSKLFSTLVISDG